MNDYQQYFKWTGVQVHHFYIYFFVALIIAGYLVFKSSSKYKIELFFLSFYLLTGNLNKILTIKIPGLSLFEIQPIKIILFLFLYLIFKKAFLSKEKLNLSSNNKVPWFLAALSGYILFLIISSFANSGELGISLVLRRIIDALTFVVIIIGLKLMADKPSYDLIGKAIIIGAVFSSVVSLIQFSISPYFLRIGDDRSAFGSFLRSNGIFDTEYFNSYYLIIAISWVLITMKKQYLKIALVILFSLGILTSFQRMSWIILMMVVITYLVYIEKLPFEKLALLGLTGLAIVLSISIFYYKDIKNSSLVKERLTDGVERRKGYYNMVLDNIGEKPLFGYGNLENEVYYFNMLQITRDRERAAAESGDLHSGYFSALFLYGIPAFVCFIFFVLLSVYYYAYSYKVDKYFTIPFLVSIIYMIANLTNTFLFLTYIAVLFAIHIGIGMGINQIQERSTS